MTLKPEAVSSMSARPPRSAPFAMASERSGRRLGLPAKACERSEEGAARTPSSPRKRRAAERMASSYVA
jgi:hypothetical protein